MDGIPVVPAAVLFDWEHDEDWRYIAQPHVLKHAICKCHATALRLLALNVERILNRYADLRDRREPATFRPN